MPSSQLPLTDAVGDAAATQQQYDSLAHLQVTEKANHDVSDGRAASQHRDGKVGVSRNYSNRAPFKKFPNDCSDRIDPLIREGVV